MPFRLTNQGEYAVRLMIYLASRKGQRRIPAKEIAAAQNIPQRFLRTIVSEFAKQGFLRAFKGKGGGIQLAPGAENRSLLEVIEAVEGPIYLNTCMQGEDVCEFSGQCAVHQVWHQAQDALSRILGSQRLRDLARDNRQSATLVGLETNVDMCGMPVTTGETF